MLVVLAGLLVLELFAAIQFIIVSYCSVDRYIRNYGTYYSQLYTVTCELEGGRKMNASSLTNYS